jgi:BspA type Leucine rich repeat region (6 copies)
MPPSSGRRKTRRGGAGLAPVAVFCVVLGVTAAGQDALGFSYSTNSGSLTVVGYDCSQTAVSVPEAVKVLPVSSIAAGVFSNCGGITDVWIPQSVTSIATGEFTNCAALVNIHVHALNPAFAGIGGALFDKTRRTLVEVPPGASGTYSVPTTVVSIGPGAFANCTAVTSVEVPPTVASIGDGAFANCAVLASITLPRSVTNLGLGVFQNCAGLAAVTFPASLAAIPDGAFAGCSSLAGLELPTGVASIGNTAFAGCAGLTSIMLPAELSTLAASAFSGCTNLSAIAVSPFNRNFSAIDGVLFDFGHTTLIQCPPARFGTYAIPGGVSAVAAPGFSGCGRLTRVTIPNSVTSLAAGAFANCAALAEVDIGEGVSSIPTGLFNGCTSLAAFAVSALNPVYVSIGGMLCDTTRRILVQCPPGLSGTVVLPAGLTSVASEAFSGCADVTNVVLPASLNAVDAAVFAGCSSLGSISVDAGNRALSAVNGALFDAARHTLLWCPAGWAGNFSVPDGVTTIQASAFAGCTNLLSVVVPGSVVTIGSGAFAGCTSLVGAYFAGDYRMGFATNLFAGDSDVTVFYLGNGVRWTHLFTGAPVMSWTPQWIWRTNGPPSFLGEGFAMGVTWAPGGTVYIDGARAACATRWEPVASLVMTNGSATYVDSKALNSPNGFYRLRW